MITVPCQEAGSNAFKATAKLGTYLHDSNASRNFARYSPLPFASLQQYIYKLPMYKDCRYFEVEGYYTWMRVYGPTKKMNYVTVKQAEQPLVDLPQDWYGTKIHMFNPRRAGISV